MSIQKTRLNLLHHFNKKKSLLSAIISYSELLKIGEYISKD